jgi:hypothetical protein
MAVACFSQLEIPSWSGGGLVVPGAAHVVTESAALSKHEAEGSGHRAPVLLVAVAPHLTRTAI